MLTPLWNLSRLYKVLVKNSRAIGVEVEQNGEIFKVYGNDIVLSAGPIGSPHILQASGIGPGGLLKNNNIDKIYLLNEREFTPKEMGIQSNAGAWPWEVYHKSTANCF